MQNSECEMQNADFRNGPCCILHSLFHPHGARAKLLVGNPIYGGWGRERFWGGGKVIKSDPLAPQGESRRTHQAEGVFVPEQNGPRQPPAHSRSTGELKNSLGRVCLCAARRQVGLYAVVGREGLSDVPAPEHRFAVGVIGLVWRGLASRGYASTQTPSIMTVCGMAGLPRSLR